MDTVTAQETSEGYLAQLRRLPVVCPADLLAGRHLVVVAPHPDDESLGLGGLLAAARSEGVGTTVVFLTDGEASHVGSPTYPPSRLAQLRRTEAIGALAALGIPAAAAHFFGLGDSRLSSLDRAQFLATVQRLAAILPDVPTLLCVTADTDPHSDHRAAAGIVRHVPARETTTVMHYPVWTWTVAESDLPDRAPAGVRVDVRDFLRAKRRAVAAHQSQQGHVVHDAKEAFVLAPEFLHHFLGPTETLTWAT
jgi:LmbE family N-acetylglucosaminyl deacetylase